MTSQIAPVAADALEQWLGATKVAIVYDPTALYTQTVATALQSQLQQDGVTITAFEPIQPGEKDYSSTVEKVAATGPDVIYAATYYPEGGLVAKAMLAQKVTAKCVADYGSYDAAFVTTAGLKAARNCPVVGVPAPTDFPDSARFVGRVPQAVRDGAGHVEPLRLRLGALPRLRRAAGRRLRRRRARPPRWTRSTAGRGGRAT